MNRDSSKHAAPVVGTMLVALTLAAFWPVLRADFINYDDPFYVTNNPQVRDGLNWQNARWAFTALHASNWHPLTWMSHMLDCTLFGLNPRGHHAVNLALHTANVLLLLLVLRRFTGSLWRSALVAALFAVHPLHVESVAWVSERKDVLSAFFALLTLLAYGGYVRNLEGRRPKLGGRPQSEVLRVWGAYGLALLFFALGLLSKPMLVTLPCLMLLLDYWPLQRVAKRERQEQPGGPGVAAGPRPHERGCAWLVVEKLPFFLLVAGSCVLTVIAQSKGGSVAPIGDITLTQRLANSVVAYGWYVWKLFWPVDLAIIYPLFPTRPMEEIVGAVVLVSAATGLAVWQARRRPPLFVGWFWYVGLLVPVIGFVQVGMQSYADRYTYLPYIGLFILLAWLAAEWTGAVLLRRCVAAGVAVAALGACVLLTQVQCGHWQDAETVFARAIQVTRKNYIAHNNLGYALADRQEFASAIEHYQAALEAAPYYADAFNNLGCAYLGLKQPERALEAFRTAVRIKPDDARLRNNLGSALHDTGDLTGAIAEYEATLRLTPDYAEAHYNLANSLGAAGRRPEAKEHYRRALGLQPKYAEAHLNLAIDLMADGANEEALAHAQQAVAVKPEWFPAQVGLAAALRALNRAEEAAAQYRRALRLQPDHAGTHYQLGQLLAAQDKPAESRAAFAEAVRLVSTNADFRLALALALGREGKAAEAVRQYHEALRLAPDRPDTLNNLAWFLASHPDANVRNGTEAVRLAERACELTGDKEPLLVGTLAAACAEAGRFADAVRIAGKAIALAEAAGLTEIAVRNRQLLELYRAGRPFHETP